MSDIIIPTYETLPSPSGYQSFIKDLGPLVCDHYALTMTYAAWKLGFADEKHTTSNVFCRSYLNNGDKYKDANGNNLNVTIPYLVNAGLGLVAEWFEGWKWTDRELRFLAQQNAVDAKGNSIRAFPNEFLYWLSQQRLSLNIDAIPEGQLIFPQEPSLRLNGLWWQQMAVEASTLNMISSSTNLATVATQVRHAAQRTAQQNGASLVEASTKDIENAGLSDMSLRRSTSISALQSARGAAIAKWDNTSNDYAAMCYGIPVMGTFAHAWVMLHDTEEAAFENWAKVFPGSTVFLADTYNTAEGVRTAIRICKKHDLNLKGIRLDSGNMAHLSSITRELLDKAGYTKSAILATDSLTVRSAASLYRYAKNTPPQESFITGLGVGSEIAVNQNNPLLGFVLKLCSLHENDSTGRDELKRELIKLSESEEKTTLPGEIDVIRYIDKNNEWAGDTIIPADMNVGNDKLSRDVYSESLRDGKVKVFPAGAKFQRLLEPWTKNGEMLQPNYINRDAAAILRASRETCQDAMKRLNRSHKHLPPNMPHNYGVGIAAELAQKRKNAIQRIRANTDRAAQLDRFGL